MIKYTKRAKNPAITAFLGASALIALCLPAPAWAQDEGDDAPKTIQAMVEDYSKKDGLFPIYTDPETGAVMMEISADQLDQEFIAFSYTENGVLEAGHFRGAYRDNRVLSLHKQFGHIEVVENSTAFYFDKASALSRAKDANISPAILASLEIVATTEGDEDTPARYLIDAGALFLNETLHKVSPAPNPMAGPTAFNVGGLSPEMTKFADIRSYPDNIDVVVDYVYNNPNAIAQGSDAVTDARSVTLKMQHSFLAMPDDGFAPRRDDYRVGYFFDQVTDLTSPDAAPYRDAINRWRLVKKDPEAALSDPVTPITWWIENTTPTEYRDTIKKAVLTWNQSFEKAGFTNAMEVKVQPDDAEWDAGDIRYNVLRWTSSPIPPFGGYGPSFTNPRTGEILGADIMLEYTFVTNRLVTSDVFETAALGLPDAPDTAHLHREGDEAVCSFGHHLHLSTLFALSAAQTAGASEEDQNALVHEGLYYLMLHEVGHTLGLNHNMKASSLYGPKEVHDASITKGAPTGSVMDYPSVNIAPLDTAQGDFYMQRPGPYDDWAIEFGYRPSLADPDAEAARIAALLARSSEPGNMFGNDADDMRRPGRGIDPRVMISDMSSDPVAYGIDRILLSRAVLAGLADRYGDADSWQPLVQAYLITTGQQASMGAIMSRQVGGVYVERTAPGQDPDTAPFTPVPAETQRAAMRALGNYIFAADAFAVPANLVSKLQTQRRGFNLGRGPEDPKIHARALSAQMRVLDHLLHPQVITRLTDSQLYGGDYSSPEMIMDLNTIIFGEDLTRTPNSFRRNLQLAYVERLLSVTDHGGYDATGKAAILAGLQDIRSRMGLFDFHLAAETKAHRAQIDRMLRRYGL